MSVAQMCPEFVLEERNEPSRKAMGELMGHVTPFEQSISLFTT